jgi:hypothetical protein
LEYDPTHRVVHTEGFEVRIFVPQSIMMRINSRDTKTKRSSRNYVCFKFREACEKQYGDAWELRAKWYVDWNDITVRSLH